MGEIYREERDRGPRLDAELIEIMPTFEGNANEDVKVFFTQFRRFASMMNLTTSQMTCILISRLRGKAYEWIRANEKLHAEKEFTIVEKEITEYFNEESAPDQRCKKFCQLKHKSGVKIKQFAVELENTTRKWLQIPDTISADFNQALDTMLSSKFIESLDREIRIEIKKRGPKTFEEALELAQRFEAIIEEEGCLTVNDKQTDKVQRSMSRDVIYRDTMIDIINTLQVKYGERNVQTKRVNWEEKPHRKHIRVHREPYNYPSQAKEQTMVRNKTRRKKRVQGGNREYSEYQNSVSPIKDADSRQMRHNDQFELKGADSKQMESIDQSGETREKGHGSPKIIVNNNLNVREKDGLPLVEVRIGNERAVALLDSGASVSLVDWDTFEQFRPLTKMDNLAHNVQIKTLTNSIIEFDRCVEFSFHVGKKMCKNVFFITKNKISPNYSIILGYDYLKGHQAIMDTGAQVLRFDTMEVPYITTEGHKSKILSELPQKQRVQAVMAKKIVIPPKEMVKTNLKLVPQNINVNNGKFDQGHRRGRELVVEVVQQTKIETGTETQGTYSEVGMLPATLTNLTNNPMHLNKNMKMGNINMNHTIPQDLKVQIPKQEIENNIVKDKIPQDLRVQVPKQGKSNNVGRLEIPKDLEVQIPKQENLNNITVEDEDLKKIRQRRRDELSIADFALDHLEGETRKEVEDLLMEYAHVFSKNYHTLGYTTRCQPKIELIHEYPIRAKAYPIPKHLKTIAKQEIDALLDAKIIEKSQSSYGSPVLLVKKKLKTAEGFDNWRLTIDYRVINAATEGVPSQLPRVKEILNAVAGHKWYSSCDLKAAFHQQILREVDRPKAAFITPWGVYQPLRMNYGMKNNALSFSKLMAEVLEELDDPAIQFYIDDIIIAGNSIQEVLQKMKRVLQLLAQNNLTLEPKKLHVCKREITVLGFKVSEKGVEPSDDHANKISTIARPHTKRNVKSFLGLCNYFRFLIKNYADISYPLVEITKPKVKFVWTQECEEAFERLKTALTSNPVVRPPDMKKTFFLCTDASATAVAAILLQEDDDGNKYIIEHFSRKLRQAEMRYPAIKAELLAIKEGMAYFREFLIGARFVLLSDAKSLMFKLDINKQTDVMQRWLIQVSTFDFKFKFISGDGNPSDYLSREILPDALQTEVINTIIHQELELNSENIKIEQSKDPSLIPILEAFKAKKQVKKCFKNYDINGHGLLTIWHKKKSKIVIPASLRRIAIKKAHTAHIGVNRTMSALTSFFFWKGMSTDVKNYVLSCHECLRYKKKNIPNAPPIKVHRPEYPGCTISVDLLGKYDKSNGGHSFIINIEDLYSRFVDVTPIKNITAATIVRELTRYLCNYGPATKIITDNGSQFTSFAFQNLLKKWSIKHSYSSVYYPQANAMIERSHSSLKDSIAALTGDTFDWHLKIPECTLWYNVSIHSQTGFAPAKLFLQRDINHPLYPEAERATFDTYQEFVNYNNVQNLLIQQETMKIQKKCQERQMEKAPFVRKREFKVGQKVYLKNFTRTKALQHRFQGPFIVQAVHPNNNVSMFLKSDPDKNIVKVNIKKVFIAQERLPHLAAPEQQIEKQEEPKDGPAFNLRSRKRATSNGDEVNKK